MGRTVPSFRIALTQEKREWKPFRNALDKSERKEFDEMWDIAKLYVSACSNSCQLVPFQPIIISILFHHYKELKKCSKQIGEITGTKSKNVGNVSSTSDHQSNSDSGGIVVMMTAQEEKPLETYDVMMKEMEEEITTTLDAFLIENS